MQSFLGSSLSCLIFSQQFQNSVAVISIQTMIYDFFLSSKPSVSDSTSVGIIDSLTAFFDCLSLRGFFSNTLKSSSLSVNLSNLCNSIIDSLSNDSISGLLPAASLAWDLFLSGLEKLRISTLLDLKFFFIISFFSIRRRYSQVELARGKYPSFFWRETLSSKFFSLFSLFPTSITTFLDDISTLMIECSLPKSRRTSTLSRQILDSQLILSQDWKYAWRSSSDALSCVLLLSSRMSGFLEATCRKRAAPLKGVA